MALGSGALVALALVLWRGVAGETMKRVWFVLRSLGRGVAPYREKAELDVSSGLGHSLPRGVVVAMAVLVWLAYGASL